MILSGGVLAVDQSTEGDQIVGIRAAKADGVIAVAVAFVVYDVVEAWQQIEAIMGRGMTLVIGATLDLHAPPSWVGRYELAGQTELSTWTAGVRHLILTGQVVHDGNRQLAEHVSRAVSGRGLGGTTLTLSTVKSPGPIEMCRAMVWAVALSAKPPTKKPALGFSSR